MREWLKRLMQDAVAGYTDEARELTEHEMSLVGGGVFPQLQAS